MLLAAVFLVTSEFAQAQEQKYTQLQIKAVGLLPTFPEEILPALKSKGTRPQSATEHFIFSCLAPSVALQNKRDKLTDQQFAEQFGDLAVEITEAFKQEEICLRNGVTKGKIVLPAVKVAQ